MTAALKESRGKTDRVKQEKKTRGSQALAARELVASLSVHGWGDTYVDYIVAGRIFVSRSVRYLLLRYNAVDFYERKQRLVNFNTASQGRFMLSCTSRSSHFLPVRMLLKASSTLVESKADVSINERVFFSESKKTRTKRLYFSISECVYTWIT